MGIEPRDSEDRKLALYKFIADGEVYDKDKYDSLEEAVESEIKYAGYGDAYRVDGGEYLVLTDSEADEDSKESVKDLLDDVGVEGFNVSIEDFADKDWFEEALEEYTRSYAEDIMTESADEPYINRLHEEMVEAGIIDEPDEDEEITRDDVEDKIDDFVEWYVEGVGDPIQYYIDNFGEEFFNKAIKENGLLDKDKFAEHIVSTDGRGHILNSYDGEEYEENGYYIYRIN